MPKAVAIDSNALTYLIEANQDGYDPAIDVPLGKQRLAMIRTFLYSDHLLWVGPTVQTEYKKIPNPEKQITIVESPGTCWRINRCGSTFPRWRRAFVN